MKKSLWIPVVILLSVVLAGCVGGGGETGTPTPTATPTATPTPTEAQTVTITFYQSYNDEEMNWLTTVLQQFNQQYPYIQVELTTVGFFDAASKAQSAILAGINVPDIVRVDPGQVWDLIPFAEELTALTGKTADDLLGVYIDSVRASCQLGDKVYALPDKVNSVVVYYNKEIFQRYGVEEPHFDLSTGDIWTFQDFINKIRTITHQDEGIYGFEMYVEGLWWYLPWIYSNGGDWISSDLHSTILGELPQAAYEAIAALYTNIAMGYDAYGTSPPDDFINGKVAMIVDGPWDYSRIVKAIGEENLGLAPIPAGTEGSISNIGGANFVIISPEKSGHETHPYEAYLLAKFITSYDSQKLKFTMLKQIPIEKQAYNEAVNAPNLDLHSMVFFWQANHAKSRPLVGGYGSVEGTFNTYVREFVQGIVGSGREITPNEVQQLFSQIDAEASQYLTTEITT